jgi:hypothetical protein
MPIKPPTADALALAAKRESFLKRHRLREFRPGAYNLMRMVGTTTGDRAAVARIRERFTIKGPTGSSGTARHGTTANSWGGLACPLCW